MTISPRTFASLSEALREAAGVLKAAVPLLRAYRGGVDPALRERVMVAVSRANDCRGCTRVHERWALRSGVGNEELEAIGLADLAALDAVSRAAVVYATERAERRFRASASGEVERVAVERLPPGTVAQIDAIARAMAFANLSLNTLTTVARPDRSARLSHPIFARVWQLIAPRAIGAQDRARLLAGLHGDIVEIGAGNGLNFDKYPSTARSVLAVEPEPRLRRSAERAAATAKVPVDVLDTSAEALPFADDSFDAAVACLVLCSVPAQSVALAELRRVLRPGAQLRFYEHVVARAPRLALLQRALDTSGIWPRLGAGCHLARDTIAAIEGAGFTVEQCERFTSARVPHITGVARAPDNPTLSE